MKTHFELSPAEYERGRQGHLHRRRIELVAGEVARVAAGEVVLELGSGSGDVLAAVARDRPDVRFVGIDLDEAMVKYAGATHARPNVTYERRDLVTAPPELRATLVFGIDVLHHVPSPDAFVTAVARLLASGGRWLAIEPDSRNPYIWLHQERMRRAGLDEDHFHRRAFERAWDASGLELVEQGTAFVVPGTFQRVPKLVARVELCLERVPGLAGSVVYVVAS